MDTVVDLFNDHSRKIATGISIILIVLMSLSVANTVLFVLDSQNPSSDLELPAPSLNSSTKQKINHKVSNLELFGKPQAAEAVPEVVDAPETKLNLELQGVFIADEPKFSTAIVAEKNKTGELFVIGDRLPGNATLAAVHVDHVLLRRGSRMEKLLFSDSEFRFVATEPAPAQANATADQRAQTRSNLERIRDRIRNNKAQSPMQAVNTPSNSGDARHALNQYREKLQNDPAGTLSEVGISAVSEGEAKGYRVDEQATGAIRQAGLQPGDVVLSVNGRPVGSAVNDSALMEQVMASSRVRVEVQRGSRRFFLTVPVPK